jgi:uncharacterized protein (TIGR03067 family)
MRFLAAAVCAALVAGCSGEADFSGAIQTEILPAETYEAEIRSIDRFLFREAPLGKDGVKTLGETIDGLAKRVAAAHAGSKFLKLESLELRLLGEHARSLPPDGTGKRLQNDWMRIRNNLFDDRAWFARSAADLEAEPATVATTSVAPQPEPVPKAFIAHPAKRPTTLNGTWQVTSMSANGKPRTDDEISGSTWTFDLPRLVVHDGRGHETTYNCAVQDDYLEVTTPDGKDGWMKFALDDDGLRIAFFDNLQGKPSGFEAAPDGNPLLVLVRLVSAP